MYLFNAFLNYTAIATEYLPEQKRVKHLCDVWLSVNKRHGKNLDVSLLWTMRVKKEKIDCHLARKVTCHNQQPSQYLLAISQQWKQ